MRRRNVLIAVGVLIVLSLAGVGAARILAANSSGNAPLVAVKPSTCGDAYRVLKLRPSEIAAARPVCLAQTLQISGELNGNVGQAYPVAADGVGPSAMCSVPRRWDNYPQVLLAFAIGGKGYRLRISTPGWSEHQAVVLHDLQGHVELASVADPKADWSQAAGTLGVDASGVAGTLDANLSRDVAAARPVHVIGRWACGAASSVSADSGVPCSLFYALNQLQDADVTRMKTSGCKSEDLTLSGAVTGHLASAINDAGYAYGTAPYADNICSATGDRFVASLKFSIGDESFLLDLFALASSAIGPGQYDANSSPLGFNTALWLGTADAANHGEFQTDQQVYWYGTQGSFTISSDLRSGTIDETLRGLFDHSSSAVHLSGSWRCG